MNYPVTIIFTPAEFAIIEHRLTVPDAIVEALTDDSEAYIEGDEIRYEAAANMMAVSGPTVTLKGTYDYDVLLDAVEGSTMPAIALDMIDYGTDEEAKEGKSIRRMLRVIEKKMADAGIPAKFPLR